MAHANLRIATGVGQHGTLKPNARTKSGALILPAQYISAAGLGTMVAASNANDGYLYHILDEGLDRVVEQLFCPACGDGVIARRGSQNAWHFAHKGMSGDGGNPVGCSAGETVLHRIAKSVIQDAGHIHVPAIWARVVPPEYAPTQRISPIFAWRENGLWETGEDLPDRASAWEEIEMRCLAVEKSSAGIRPDLICDMRGPSDFNSEVFVEVRVAHKVPPEKVERTRAAGIPMLEVDLSGSKARSVLDEISKSERGDKSEIRWCNDLLRRFILKEAPRHWLYNPEIDAARAAASAEASARTAMAKQAWAAEERRREEERLEHERQRAAADEAARLEVERLSREAAEQEAQNEEQKRRAINELRGRWSQRTSRSDWMGTPDQRAEIFILGAALAKRGVIGDYGGAAAAWLLRCKPEDFPAHILRSIRSGAKSPLDVAKDLVAQGVAHWEGNIAVAAKVIEDCAFAPAQGMKFAPLHAFVAECVWRIQAEAEKQYIYSPMRVTKGGAGRYLVLSQNITEADTRAPEEFVALVRLARKADLSLAYKSESAGSRLAHVDHAAATYGALGRLVASIENSLEIDMDDARLLLSLGWSARRKESQQGDDVIAAAVARDDAHFEKQVRRLDSVRYRAAKRLLKAWSEAGGIGQPAQFSMPVMQLGREVLPEDREEVLANMKAELAALADHTQRIRAARSLIAECDAEFARLRNARPYKRGIRALVPKSISEDPWEKLMAAVERPVEIRGLIRSTIEARQWAQEVEAMMHDLCLGRYEPGRSLDLAITRAENLHDVNGLRSWLSKFSRYPNLPQEAVSIEERRARDALRLGHDIDLSLFLQTCPEGIYPAPLVT